MDTTKEKQSIKIRGNIFGMDENLVKIPRVIEVMKQGLKKSKGWKIDRTMRDSKTLRDAKFRSRSRTKKCPSKKPNQELYVEEV